MAETAQNFNDCSQELPTASLLLTIRTAERLFTGWAPKCAHTWQYLMLSSILLMR